MAVDDPNDDVRKYKNTREQVREADIPTADRDALLDFGEAKFTASEASTAKSNLYGGLKIARLAVDNDLPPLTEWAKTDFDTFSARLVRGDLDGVPDDGYSKNYNRSLQQYTKNFMKELGRDWVEDVEIGAAPDSEVTRDDLITQDELAALFGAAEHPRDQCLIALPLATFQRNAALRALRIKDVTLTENPQSSYITLNDDADGQKRASGKRPLTWASAYVEQWLDVHPRRDDPDAPLLCVIGNSGNASRGDPMSKNDTYNQRLRTIAERAGLPEDRYRSSVGRRERTLGAHLLRHTGVTRAGLNEELTDQVIKKWAGWTEDSDRLRDYMHLTDDDLIAAAAGAYGDDDVEHDLAERPDPGECDRCGHPTEAWMQACPNCTMLLTVSAGMISNQLDEIEEEATDTAIESTDRETIEIAKLIRDSAADPEALREDLRGVLDEG